MKSLCRLNLPQKGKFKEGLAGIVETLWPLSMGIHRPEVYEAQYMGRNGEAVSIGRFLQPPRARRHFLTRLTITRAWSRILMLLELPKRLGAAFPDTWNKFLFRRFLGEGGWSGNTYFVLDNYGDVRLRQNLDLIKDFLRATGNQSLVESEIT